MQTKEKARHPCGGRARLHIDVQFSIDRDRRPHPADPYDVPDYAGRKIEVAHLLRLIREQDAFRPCREPIAETCDLGDGDGDRSWFSDRVRVSLGHVHSTCSGSGLACAVRAGRRHRDATPESSHGLGLLRPAPRSGAWPRPCRRRRRSVSARVQGHGRRAVKPRTGATIGSVNFTGSSIRLETTIAAVTTEAPHWRRSRRGRIQPDFSTRSRPRHYRSVFDAMPVLSR